MMSHFVAVTDCQRISDGVYVVSGVIGKDLFGTG